MAYQGNDLGVENLDALKRQYPLPVFFYLSKIFDLY